MTESGFEIDGRVYPVPTLGSFDMDEAQVLYDYSGLTLEDFATAGADASAEELEAREQRLKNPGFIRSLLHIAYQRGNPELRRTKVAELVGKVNLVAAVNDLMGDESEDDALPPELTTEPDRSSRSGSVGSSKSSGDGSANGSELPVSDLPRIGHLRSDTSPTSGRETSAV